MEVMDTPVAPSALHRVTPKTKKMVKNKQNSIHVSTGHCGYVSSFDSFYLLVDTYFDIALQRFYLWKNNKASE